MTGGIAICVYGQPITQGSKVANRHGGGVRDDNAKALKPWRKKMHDAAIDAARYTDTITTPVFIRITFSLTRPKAHYRTGRFAELLRDDAPRHPAALGRDDIDKLCRAAFDSLTTAEVLLDDALVVDVRARKVWAGEHEHALDRPGVRVEIVPLTSETP